MKKATSISFALNTLSSIAGKVIWSISFSFMISPLPAQKINTRLYNTNDGLPVSTIYCTREDHNGYLWIGTPNGISRFDGRNFVNYSLADGLPSPHVDYIFEDSRNRLWIGTRKGIARMAGNRFLCYPLNDSLKINFTFKIIETRSGEIWALTSKGVYQFNDSIWRKVKLFPGYENFYCRQIIEATSGLYINYGNLIIHKDNKNNWKIIARNFTGYPFFNQLSLYNNGILVSSRNQVFSCKPDTLVPLTNAQRGKEYTLFFTDSKQRLWHIMQNQGRHFTISKSNKWKETEMTLPNNYGIISNISEDSHGNIWVCTQEGLLKIKDASFILTDDSKLIRLGKIISAISIENSGLILSSENGLYTYFPSSMSQKSRLKLLSALPVYTIDSYAYDSVGAVWFITRTRKLFCYKNNTLIDCSRLLSFKSTGYLTSCAYDVNNNRLLISGDSTLFIGNHHKMNVFNTSPGILPSSFYSRIISTRKGNILLKIDNRGIYKINNNDSLSMVLTDIQKPQNQLIFEDNEDKIWLTYENSGLGQFHFNKIGQLELVQMLSESDGLQNNSVYSIATDALNRIWLITATGLDILEKTKEGKWIVYNYSKNEGPIISNWLEASLITDSNGDVWITGWRNLIKFDTRNIHLKKDPPSVTIENIQTKKREINYQLYTDSLKELTGKNYLFRFQYKEVPITINFNGASFSFTPHLEYSYQLIPTDTTWSRPNSTRSVSYVNLDPGNYTFSVKTRDQASEWSQSALFNFSISTPFWNTQWFKILFLLVPIPIIYLLYYNKVSHLKNILTVRKKISQDLHDEVGATLSGISLYSHLAKEQLNNSQPGEIEKILTIIQDSSSEMVNRLNDIIWIANPNNDSMIKLIERLDEYASRVSAAKKIYYAKKFHANIDKIKLPMETRRNIYLICKESINNAVKYSNCTQILFETGIQKNTVEFIITDDGSGFDKNTVKKGNGLQNMENRAAELKGQLSIQSSPGTGTTICLICKIT